MVFDPFAAVELAAWILRHYQVIIYLSFHAYDWQIKYTQQTSSSFRQIERISFPCGSVGSIHSISTLMLIILDYW